MTFRLQGSLGIAIPAIPAIPAKASAKGTAPPLAGLAEVPQRSRQQCAAIGAPAYGMPYDMEPWVAEPDNTPGAGGSGGQQSNPDLVKYKLWRKLPNGSPNKELPVLKAKDLDFKTLEQDMRMKFCLFHFGNDWMTDPITGEAAMATALVRAGNAGRYVSNASTAQTGRKIPVREGQSITPVFEYESARILPKYSGKAGGELYGHKIDMRTTQLGGKFPTTQLAVETKMGPAYARKHGEQWQAIVNGMILRYRDTGDVTILWDDAVYEEERQTAIHKADEAVEAAEAEAAQRLEDEKLKQARKDAVKASRETELAADAAQKKASKEATAAAFKDFNEKKEDWEIKVKGPRTEERSFMYQDSQYYKERMMLVDRAIMMRIRMENMTEELKELESDFYQLGRAEGREDEARAQAWQEMDNMAQAAGTEWQVKYPRTMRNFYDASSEQRFENFPWNDLKEGEKISAQQGDRSPDWLPTLTGLASIIDDALKGAQGLPVVGGKYAPYANVDKELEVDLRDAKADSLELSQELSKLTSKGFDERNEDYAEAKLAFERTQKEIGDITNAMATKLNIEGKRLSAVRAVEEYRNASTSAWLPKVNLRPELGETLENSVVRGGIPFDWRDMYTDAEIVELQKERGEMWRSKTGDRSPQDGALLYIHHWAWLGDSYKNMYGENDVDFDMGAALAQVDEDEIVQYLSARGPTTGKQSRNEAFFEERRNQFLLEGRSAPTGLELVKYARGRARKLLALRARDQGKLDMEETAEEKAIRKELYDEYVKDTLREDPLTEEELRERLGEDPTQYKGPPVELLKYKTPEQGLADYKEWMQTEIGENDFNNLPSRDEFRKAGGSAKSRWQAFLQWQQGGRMNQEVVSLEDDPQLYNEARDEFDSRQKLQIPTNRVRWWMAGEPATKGGASTTTPEDKNFNLTVEEFRAVNPLTRNDKIDFQIRWVGIAMVRAARQVMQNIKNESYVDSEAPWESTEESMKWLADLDQSWDRDAGGFDPDRYKTYDGTNDADADEEDAKEAQLVEAAEDIILSGDEDDDDVLVGDQLPNSSGRAQSGGGGMNAAGQEALLALAEMQEDEDDDDGDGDGSSRFGLVRTDTEEDAEEADRAIGRRSRASDDEPPPGDQRASNRQRSDGGPAAMVDSSAAKIHEITKRISRLGNNEKGWWEK